jgi:hypothetical protein
MTEQQIQKLRKILQQSEPEAGQSELDSTILTEARKRASEYSQTRTSFFSWLAGSSGSALQLLSTASLAIITTLVLLLGLGQLTSVNPPQAHHGEEQTVLTFEQPAVEPPLPSATDRPVMAQRPALPDTRATLDQMLMDTELPTIETVLTGMDFSLIDDPTAVRQSIAVAFDEIRFLLGDGDVDDARLRYAQLRKSCVDCELPESLEALVLNVNGQSRNT